MKLSLEDPVPVRRCDHEAATASRRCGSIRSLSSHQFALQVFASGHVLAFTTSNQLVQLIGNGGSRIEPDSRVRRDTVGYRRGDAGGSIRC